MSLSGQSREWQCSMPTRLCIFMTVRNSVVSPLTPDPSPRKRGEGSKNDDSDFPPLSPLAGRGVGGEGRDLPPDQPSPTSGNAIRPTERTFPGAANSSSGSGWPTSTSFATATTRTGTRCPINAWACASNVTGA